MATPSGSRPCPAPCGGCDEPVAAAEAAYFAALEGSHTVDVTDRDRLVLTRDDQRLEYEAAPRG